MGKKKKKFSWEKGVGRDFAFPFVIPLSHLFPEGVQHVAKAGKCTVKEIKLMGKIVFLYTKKLTAVPKRCIHQLF